MSSPAILARFEAGRAIVREAGELARRRRAEFDSLTVETKLNGQDVATSADREVEALIRARVAAAFAGDGVLGEEEGLVAGDGGPVWVVDPIDGTSPFLHGLSSWCVSIALHADGDTAFGYIYDPSADELFAARTGGGATLNGRPIAVDRTYDLSTGLTGLGANHRVPAAAVTGFAARLLEAGGMFIRNGSGALMLAHVACGRLVAYYEPHINLWDCAAGLCLVREAGGWTTEFPEDPATTVGSPLMVGAPQIRAHLEALAAGA